MIHRNSDGKNCSLDLKLCSYVPSPFFVFFKKLTESLHEKGTVFIYNAHFKLTKLRKRLLLQNSPLACWNVLTEKTKLCVDKTPPSTTNRQLPKNKKFPKNRRWLR